MRERASVRRRSWWTWVAVGACLVVLDLSLFRIGLLWKLTPDFGPGLGGENWRMLYAAARTFESEPPRPGTAVIVGSSVVLYGTDVTAINARLGRDQVPVELARFVTHGSTATDSALLLWNAKTLHPWLSIYGVAARDFPKVGPIDSSVARTFYDSSLELPALPRRNAETKLAAYVKRYWKLYRYRFFTRMALAATGARWIRKLGLPTIAHADEPPPPERVPPEAARYFPPFRITPASWAAWDRWRQSRQFSDFLAWLSYSGGMATAIYKTQTVASFGPADNPHAAALTTMLAGLERDGTRGLLLYFPENPVFRAPEAREYFDPALSDGYAALLRSEAAAHGARFEDLRDVLQPEDFYDLIHPNLEGQRKLSARIAELIEEEWAARQRVDN